MSASSEVSGREDRTFFFLNVVVSAGALGVLAWLLLFREGGGEGLDLRAVPAINAGLNATAAALLTAGWLAIRTGRVRLHKALMVAAFVTSTLFLVGYLAYHYVHGDTRYEGEGLGRTLYFVVLISHVLLSIPVVPMALSAFYFAWRQRFDRHRRIARVLAPIWLYVSVTGVLVYVMLHGG